MWKDYLRKHSTKILNIFIISNLVGKAITIVHHCTVRKIYKDILKLITQKAPQSKNNPLQKPKEKNKQGIEKFKLHFTGITEKFMGWTLLTFVSF